MPDVNITYKGSSIATMNDSGTKTLKTGGKYCQNDIVVEYIKPEGGGVVGSTNCKTFIVDVTTKPNVNIWLSWIPADADIAAHRNDATFGVSFQCLTAPIKVQSIRGGLYSNSAFSYYDSANTKPYYGYYMRNNSSGVGGVAPLETKLTVKSTAAGACYVGTDGSISFYVSSSYPTQTGTYQIIVWW